MLNPSRQHYLVGKGSPWGAIDYAETLVPGIDTVSTPSHGGIKLDREHNAKVPDYMRAPGGWYEEDCQWSIPFVVFADEINANGHENAKKIIAEGTHLTTLRTWYPDEYEQWTGTTLKPGESFIRDERNWRADHVNDIQVYSAIGVFDGSGMVEVTACVGGRSNVAPFLPCSMPQRFLVPADEYDTRMANPAHTFIVDPARHQEITNA